jgi:hypothetical protein
MAKKTPPRKLRNVKNALSASEASSVEIDDSNCSAEVTLEEVMNYQNFGFGKDGQTYLQGQVTDFASVDDQQKSVTGRTATGEVFNLKDASSLIERSVNAGLATNSANHYFSGVRPSGAVTGSNVVFHVYGQSGPQAGYIPQLVHGSQGISAGQQYVFFIPSGVTGSGGTNMPAIANRSLEVTIAGAVGGGESMQVYTASIDGTAVATGSAFTYSGSFCDTPNYQVQTMYILTSSLAGGNPATSKAGILIVYTSSYADHPVSNPKASNTPYAGVVVSIAPSAITSSA